MHELSIAMSLVQMADEAARKAEATQVTALYVRVGALSSVVPDALRFSFDLAAAGTLVEGARLEIEELPVRVFCIHCGVESELPSPQVFRCPICQRPTGQLVQGRELELTSLEVE
ncbi:hydrogenase maturation nickel metallochaperone HypA [Oscillochloris sp. ZM17-4]|uniref:hydrogenase maturation nickel metallochaperone HypA n=1 Tax=Oscillochloris sp. ZM17-4 TaxID=2866714 RepID=UPI001C72A474|nr:hydrogenase maturation nickel metallochaperone HypA [Oscillochloris sp. ZM17-4]MBX0329183.1 hydrogenase maturation nickel metallochaperone HypA [Oscillochloris sp. ZM17-4]